VGGFHYVGFRLQNEGLALDDGRGTNKLRGLIPFIPIPVPWAYDPGGMIALGYQAIDNNANIR